MAITINYYKGQHPLDLLTEYSNFIKKEHCKFRKKDYDNFKKWKEEKGYFSESGKLELHFGNWQEKFKEFQWATISLNEALNKATIKEFSDYPIEYRCGRACLTYLTIDLFALYIDMQRYFREREYHDVSLPTYKCSYGMQLYEWEVRAIYAMMRNFENIEKETIYAR